MTRSHWSQAHQVFTLSMDRIAAHTGAIVAHLVFFALLLIPVAQVLPPFEIKTITDPVPIEFLPSKQEHEVPPMPEAPPQTTQSISRQPEIVTNQPDMPVAIQADITPPPSEPGIIGEPDVRPQTPVLAGPAAISLAYISATPPKYPRPSIKDYEQGTVLLRVVVGVDGLPQSVTIEESSGYRRLDLAAQQHVLRTWKFQAAIINGVAVRAVGLVPVTFDLSQN